MKIIMNILEKVQRVYGTGTADAVFSTFQNLRMPAPGPQEYTVSHAAWPVGQNRSSANEMDHFWKKCRLSLDMQESGGPPLN